MTYCYISLYAVYLILQRSIASKPEVYTLNRCGPLTPSLLLYSKLKGPPLKTSFPFISRPCSSGHETCFEMYFGCFFNKFDHWEIADIITLLHQGVTSCGQMQMTCIGVEVPIWSRGVCCQTVSRTPVTNWETTRWGSIYTSCRDASFPKKVW